MKPLFGFLTLALLVQSLGLLQAQETDPYARPERAERARTYNALHYRVHLTFNEKTRSFRGTNTIGLTPLHDGFRHAVLDAETFVVDGVTDAAGAALAFDQQPGTLAVEFPSAYGYGDTLIFTVAYHADNVDIDSEAYGMSADYDLGIDFKEETEWNPELINTLSFPRGARHWMPCYDHPNDRATNETLLTVQSAYKALSNGRLVSVTDHKDGTHTYHWLQELPHPTYLYVAVAGPYVVLHDSLGSLPINYWVYPKDVDNAMRSFERTPEIVSFLGSVYGYPYPWVKYDQITIPGIGGGAESTTATVLGQSTIHDAAAEQDFPSDWLVAHEAAHQWWGNLVSYRDWPQTWMSESFATYSEYLWARHAHGEEEGAVNMLAKKDAYLQEAQTRYMRPIVFDRWQVPNDNLDRHTYQKGAAVLGMLQAVMGEAPFLRAISYFLKKHAFEPVDTHDFAKAIKESTGQNLDWFFEQWVFSPGHPVLDIAQEWNGSDRSLRLSVRQVQDTTAGVPVFRMPVALRIVTATEDRVETIWIEEAAAVFDFEDMDAPLLVRFDAGNHLVKEWTFEKSTKDLMYQLTHDDVIGRSWAAEQLGKRMEDANVVSELRRSAEQDVFWHVREACIRQLGRLENAALASFLKERSLDADSDVRAEALRSLGALKEASLTDYFKERFIADDS